MEQFVDIHAHIIPGIDDGPSDLEDSLDMARAAAAAGTRTLVSTPHLRQDFPDVHLEELGARCQSLREAIDAEGIPLTLVCGAEVSLLWAMAASQEQLVLASCAQRGTDLLIETPFTTVSGIDQHLFQIRAKGFRVTLAHPERSVEFQHDIELLEALVTQEILIQVNAKSLMGGEPQVGIRQVRAHPVRPGPRTRGGLGRPPRRRLAPGHGAAGGRRVGGGDRRRTARRLDDA